MNNTYPTQIISENRGERTFLNFFYKASVCLIPKPDTALQETKFFIHLSLKLRLTQKFSNIYKSNTAILSNE